MLMAGAGQLVAMHGFDRAASDFRNVLVDQAERCGLIVLVPEFDAEAFQDAYAYNYGNVRLSPPSGKVLPRNRWRAYLVGMEGPWSCVTFAISSLSPKRAA
jgi:hypothetical protein